MNTQYTKRLEKIEEALAPYLPSSPSASWVNEVFSREPGGSGGAGLSPEALEMLRRHLASEASLLGPCRGLLGRGGKRWRPLLATLVCECLGGGEAALPLVALVEFCHNASLIHDDIEDNSPRRRGEAACHIRYGLDTALNAGAFLYFLPLVCLERWDGGPREAERKQALYEIWGRHIRRLHLGQSLDIAWHRGGGLPSIGDYETMCRLKTGVLVRFACALGIFAAEADGSLEAGPVLEAAESLGVGFQILDDVKNLSTGVAGKERGDDMVEGKMSLPVLLFLGGGESEGERERREAAVRETFAAAAERGAGAAEVTRLIALFEEEGVLERAAERGRALITKSRDVFAGLAVPGREAEGALLCALPGALMDAPTG